MPAPVRQYRFRRPPGACELLLVRHGESQPADPDHPFPERDGHADPPLYDPVGLEQAERVCARLATSGEEFAAVYVTPLQRTQQTARPLLDRLGVEAVVEPDLQEVHLGEFEGGEWRRRIATGDPVVQEVFRTGRWDAIPGAEPSEAFCDRVRAGIERIAAAHPDGVVAVFTHGGVIGQAIELAVDSRGLAFSAADNGSVTHLVVMDERWVVRAYNDTGHLGERFTSDPDPLV